MRAMPASICSVLTRDRRPVTPGVASSSPVGPAKLKLSPAATFGGFRVSAGALESCNSQADSQGRDSRTRKPARKPPLKRAMFHASARVFHGKKRQKRRRKSAVDRRANLNEQLQSRFAFAVSARKGRPLEALFSTGKRVAENT